MMHPEVARQLALPTMTPLHRRLLTFATRRIDAAENRWSERYPRFQESERLLRSFRVPDAQDEQTRNDSLTEGVEKIVVPYSYAILQSMLAFMMGTLTQRKPIVPVEAKGGADVRAAMLMEMLLDSQANDMTPSQKLVWFQWLLDAGRYGVGVVKAMWEVEEWPEQQRFAVPIIGPDGQVTGYHEQLLDRDVVAYEGNRLLNVIPYDFLPDPRLPLADFQRGEFCAHRLQTTMTRLQQQEAQGVYAGVEYGVGATNAERAGTQGYSELSRTMGMSDAGNAVIDRDARSAPTLHELYAYCDARRLGLPSMGGSTPRLWMLTVMNKARIIRAEAADLPAHSFPFDIIELNYDWHSPANAGVIETVRGLQYYYSWLYNARMMAVRKTLNNECVYDPSMVEEVDILDSEPGRLIRLKREVWGDGRAKDAVFPLAIQDTTQGHLSDARIVQDLIQTITGASNIVMGMPNSGRRAATEVQGQMKLAAGRMTMLTDIACEQGLKPQARRMTKNTQAYLDLSQPRSVPLAYLSALGAPYIQILPQMLYGDFQYPFLDAGLPTDRLFEGNMWKEFMTMGIQSGAAASFAGSIPWPSIFARWLRTMGVKDLQSFGLSPMNLTVEPDARVQAMQQQGNLVPGGAMNMLPQGPASLGAMGPGPGRNGSEPPRDGFALPPMGSTPT